MTFFKNIGLVGRIIIGLILGILAGLFFPEAAFLELFGTSFINALKAVAPPLVFVLVLSALINAGQNKAGQFRKIVFLYLFSTLSAAVTAVLISFLFPVKMHFLQAVSSPAPGGLKKAVSALLSGLTDNPVSALLNAN